MAYTLLVPLYHKLLFNNRIQVWTRRIFLHVAPRHNSFIWEITSTGVMPIPNLFRLPKPLSYTYPDVHAFAEGRKKKGYLYGRINHPNFTSLNEVLARMEQGEAAWVVSSGMFAIFTALITLVKGGSHSANTNIYGETYQMLKTLLPQYGVETTFVDLNDKGSRFAGHPSEHPPFLW